ncbi:hypothetical protein M431DRAFT_527108 [Trichoderma harzianum CBS 226.95]|uniref:Uncharacterized protein n=1 Tax=Trichoderma harzianum CBS 226.95 TaxID=983964 RepID=A0A2T4AVP7_TRIHA|nr:hypothetical protein M431DRAFT_527108 [Trichoderma harzianum CBS 226.95]PTB61147.1 hypothetical protein M431DRAFT_527108 [Trichoderma harzianum CBS 226.95]
MTLTQYIFTAFSFLRPWSSSDDALGAIPRIYRYVVDTWIRRPVAPLISVTLLAALTLRLVRMAYFLPPKVSDAALGQASSGPQALLPPAPKEQQRTITGAPQDTLTSAQTERRRSTSLRGWVKNMFPSQRPERGGTSREQGYWEQKEKEGKQRPRRRMTDSQYSVGDISVDSSHITRWNVPRDISRDQPSDLPEQPLSVVPVTSKPSSPPKDVLPDRSWSWSPHNGSEEQISVTKVGGVLQRNYDQSNDQRRSSLGIQTETAAEGKQPLGQDLLRRARSKARQRERRSLRESGDYLGVQGVNPHTGELDVMSPSGSSAGSPVSHHETPRRILRTWHNVLKSHKSRDSPSRDDAGIEHEDHRVARSLRGKKKVRELNKAVRWMRRGQSSLQEPDLSPIAQSLKSVSLSSRRPSHVQHLPQAIQQPTAISTGEPPLDIDSSHAHPPEVDASDNYIATSSPPEFLEGGSALDDSGSQMSSSPTTPSEDKSFLDMEAERDVKKSCTETSKATLSASHLTQSTPAFGRGFERRFSLPGMMSMAPSSLDLHPSMFREPPRLTRREGSPLQAMPMPRSTESRIRSRDMRKRWDDHLRLSRMKAQASAGPLQRESLTMRRPAGSRHRHRRLTKMAIERDMLQLKEGVAKVDKQRLEQPHHSHNQPVMEHEQTSNVLREIRYQAPEIVESASIPTITITGYNHQTFHSAFLPDGSMNPDFLLPLSPTQQDESIYSALAVTSFENSLDGFHSDPSMSSKQNPTSSAEAEMGGEPQAGTTSLGLEAHKMQLAEGHWQDRRTAKATMPAPEDDSLRKSTFTQGQMLQDMNQCKNPSAANQEMQQLVTEKEANPVDHQTQIHNPPEEHRVYQEHQDEDGTESLLPKEANTDEAKVPNAKPEGNGHNELEDEEGEELTPLQQFLRYLKIWIRLYWATIWPILDPRTMGVAHDGPMPWWEALLLIALTVPAAALVYVVVVQGTRIVMFMAWLLEFVDDESAI